MKNNVYKKLNKTFNKVIILLVILLGVYFAKNFTNFSYFSFSFFWKIIYSRPRPPKSCLPLAEIVQNDLFCGPFFPAFPDLQKVLRRNPGSDRIFTHICINYK